MLGDEKKKSAFPPCPIHEPAREGYDEKAAVTAFREALQKLFLEHLDQHTQRPGSRGTMGVGMHRFALAEQMSREMVRAATLWLGAQPNDLVKTLVLAQESAVWEQPIASVVGNPGKHYPPFPNPVEPPPPPPRPLLDEMLLQIIERGNETTETIMAALGELGVKVEEGKVLDALMALATGATSRGREIVAYYHANAPEKIIRWERQTYLRAKGTAMRLGGRYAITQAMDVRPLGNRYVDPRAEVDAFIEAGIGYYGATDREGLIAFLGEHITELTPEMVNERIDHMVQSHQIEADPTRPGHFREWLPDGPKWAREQKAVHGSDWFKPSAAPPPLSGSSPERANGNGR